MNNIWDKVYSNDSSFFGDEPSKFALICYEEFVKHKIQKILELGCGQGRDSIFFASKGLEVYVIDSSKVAVENLRIKTKELNLDIKLKNIDAVKGLPFFDNHFDAVYSHMFYNMGFTDDELKFLFSESKRVIKNKGLLSFSVRNDKDIIYKKGTKVMENIYDINGFHIRFFTKQDIKFFVNDNFKIQNIIEDYEEPANLYFVICYKN
ncbi:MAG TPA: class I SAM-dependent methyltransferase [Nitrososphaeraceae archaeon]|nr:class I SAM-dependent methyltransferase [Nitrososphaeraceae archaeon]